MTTLEWRKITQAEFSSHRTLVRGEDELGEEEKSIGGVGCSHVIGPITRTENCILARISPDYYPEGI